MRNKLAKKTKKIGLALGSGGARGLAHIGVIKVLEKHGIDIDFIAGSSIGAVVGGLYAVTKDIAWVEKVISGNDRRQILDLIWDLAVFKGGLISGDKLGIFLRKKIAEKTGRESTSFSDLLLPFAAIATNLETGNLEIIEKGLLLTGLRASYAVPFVFRPVMVEGKMMVDGGLNHPVPVSVVRNMGADIVIGVNLDAYFPRQKIDKIQITALINPLFNIVRHNLAAKDIQSADIKVEPEIHNASLIGLKHFLKADEFIAKGEEAMEKQIQVLKNLL